jgi:aminoglycoside phosphotransferase family enzyme/predicted kinase
MSKKESSEKIVPSLIEFMKRPDSYPHQPDQVEHIQTHISHVFIAGKYVYKFKKPVNFDFLDFSTLEKRKYYCHQELKLNRRLTDDIYLEVVSIGRSGESYRLESGDPEAAVEYAVKMKRLPEEYFLHTFIEEDKLSKKHLDRVISKLTDFYLAQDPDDEISEWGKLENIKYNTDENFSQTKPFIGDTIDKNSWQAICRYTNRYFKLNRALFKRRIEEKRIVDGHGDLHLEHIHLAPDAVNIYDCIEFNDRFRYGDVAADLAFLAMDLDFNYCPRQANYFVEKMAKDLDDADLSRHINFYKCYRAYVKGKVKSLQSDEPEVGEKGREQARNTAIRYFKLALRYALLGSTPTVLVVMGRPATGKSTLAKQLSQELNIDRFSSDRIRKTIAGLPLDRRPDPEAREQLYAPEMSAQTYRRLQEEAKKGVADHHCIILDATYSNIVERERLVKVLRSRSCSYYFIEACASDEIIKERLGARTGEHTISDARLEDFEKLNRYYESPEKIDTEHLIRINTEKSLLETLDQLYRELIKWHLKEDC